MTAWILLTTLATTLCDTERQAIDEAAAAIETDYVLESRAEPLAEDLRRMAESAEPGDCQASETFAKDFTRELRTRSEDLHFVVEAPGSVDESWVAEWYAAGRENGYGVTRVEILEHNIGLLQISSFYNLQRAGDRLDAAFTLLRDTDALIVDLRGNGGGSAETAWPLQWTFLEQGGPSPLALDSRARGITKRAEPSVPWPRYGTQRPVAVLTDSRSFSAAEAVAYSLQSTGRAIVIGEPSGGGAHMLGAPIALAGGYRLHIPTTRPLSPVTGENWEGTGVQPDIEATSEAALQIALSHLRGELEASASN